MEWKNLLEVSSINDKTVDEFEGAKRYVTTGGIDFNKIIDFEETTYDSKPSRANRQVEIGDILVAKMKDTVKVLKIEEEYCDEYIFSTGFSTLKANQDILDVDYFYYVLISEEFQKEKNKYAKGATQKAINNAGLKKIEIPVPSMKIQKQIVEVLDEAQKLIDTRNEQIKLLGDLIESVFYDMFGDPTYNKKGFNLGTIRDVTKYTQYGTSKKAGTNGEFPIIRMGNLTYKGDWDFTDLKYIDLNEKEKEKYLVNNGDLLFNRTNSRELVGKTGVYKDDKEMAFAGYLIKLVPNELANTEYISAYLNSKHGKQTLLNMAKGIVGMANINAQELQNIKILIPPIQLQNQFAKKVEAIEAQKSLMQQSLNLMEDNYNSLMQLAFKGELF